MNLTSIPLLDVLRERMTWLSSRQSLLSQNVANADTPNYTAQDLKPIDFEKVLKESSAPPKFNGELTLTDPRHIAITPSPTSGSQDTASGAEIEQTGTDVSVEEEMMKVADTQAQYQTAANIYAKAIGMMRTAIDKGT